MHCENEVVLPGEHAFWDPCACRPCTKERQTHPYVSPATLKLLMVPPQTKNWNSGGARKGTGDTTAEWGTYFRITSAHKVFSTSAPIFDNFFKNQCRPGSTTPFWYHQCPPTTPPDAHVSLKSATLVLGGLQPRGQDQCIWPPSIDRSDMCVVLFFGDLSEGMWTVCVHLCAHLRSQNVCWPNRTTPFWYRQCLFQHPTGCIHYKGQHYCLVGYSLRVRTSALEPHRWEILSAQWCS